MKRFELNAENHKDAYNYLVNRSLQIAHTGAKLISITSHEYGLWSKFEYEEEYYYSLYLLNSYRGNNMFHNIYTQKCAELNYEIKMITTTACTLAPYFRYKGIPFILINGLTNTVEYQIIENIYGSNIANRSQVYLMNHIDEGLYILNKINATTEAKLGYILHPVFQSNNELQSIYERHNLKNINPHALINTMEYRSIANEYLSYRKIADIDEIRLSPLKDVNDMLIADKIQNRKDFELYHYGKHERSNQLLQYFKNWLERLNISEEYYQKIKEELILINSKSLAIYE